jgi:hypothetical protein
MPDTDVVPAGLRVEVNPDTHIVVSDLPPLVDPPRTSVNEDVVQWRDDILLVPEPTIAKGKKRARDGEEEDGTGTRFRRPRRVGAATQEPDVPAPLRRSVRLKIGNKVKTAGAGRKSMMAEEGNDNAGGSTPRARSRMSAKKV